MNRQRSKKRKEGTNKKKQQQQQRPWERIPLAGPAVTVYVRIELVPDEWGQEVRADQIKQMDRLKNKKTMTPVATASPAPSPTAVAGSGAGASAATAACEDMPNASPASSSPRSLLFPHETLPAAITVMYRTSPTVPSFLVLRGDPCLQRAGAGAGAGAGVSATAADAGAKAKHVAAAKGAPATASTTLVRNDCVELEYALERVCADNLADGFLYPAMALVAVLLYPTNNTDTHTPAFPQLCCWLLFAWSCFVHIVASRD